MRGTRPLPFLDTPHREAVRPDGVVRRAHEATVEGQGVPVADERRGRPIAAEAAHAVERPVTAPTAGGRIIANAGTIIEKRPAVTRERASVSTR
jgi:hypothetical protein